MKTRSFIIISAVSVVGAAGLGVGAFYWSVGHVQRWTGRNDLGFVGCKHCHLVQIEDLPWAKARPRHDAPADMAVSPDGQRLYVAMDDRDEIREVDVASREVTRVLRMAGAPTGLALDARGEKLYVTCRDADLVAAVDLKAFKEVEYTEVGATPIGLAVCSTSEGERLVVANSASDDVSILETSPLKELGRYAAGREPYAVACAAGGSRALVANRLATVPHIDAQPYTEVTVFDTARGRVVARERLDSAHLSEGTAFYAPRSWGLTPLVRVRNLVPITQVANGWVMSSGMAVSDLKGHVVQVPLDEANDYFADPSGIAVDAAGKRAYVTAGGSDVVSVVDLDRLAAWFDRTDPATQAEAIDDLALSVEYVIARIPTERNPRQVALSPDGRTLFVAERLNDTILVVDTATLRPQGRVALGDGGLTDPVRRGERVFTQAAHTFQRQFSCRSCHPDGHVDGLAYDFDGDGIGDNMLDNRTLQGLAGTAPFKWNGKNPTLQVQCGPRFARVLMRTDPIPPKDLDDLVAFIESQPPPRTAHKQGKPLTPAQERGRKTFFATVTADGKPIPIERQCQTCHRPPLYTNRLPSDIGTKGPRDASGMFDTPHLLGIAASAPYLHDGRAQTLEELWTVYQTNDLHGVSSYMNKHHLNDLIEFLKTL